MKKTTVMAVTLALSLIANVWLGVQLNTVNSRAVTAMASVAAAEQTASSQGAELSELTQKLADADAKTQAIQAELDKLTTLQEEQAAAEQAKIETEQAEAEQAAAKAKVLEQQKAAREEAARKEKEQQQQQQTPEDELKPGNGGSSSGTEKPSGGSSGAEKPSGGNQGGGIKEPAGGIGSTPAGKLVDGGGITDVGAWNPEMGAWWATDSSGKSGWLFPNGSLLCDW